MAMGFWGKLPPWSVLLAFLLIGLALIVVPHYLAWTWDYGIGSEIGVALLVAAILGFTIDRWLRAELRRDAFQAAIGHILLPEFRAEVSRIVGYALICERHSLLVEFTKTSNPRVLKVTSSSERIIRNRSAYPQPVKNFCAVDDWGQAEGASEILDCRMIIEGQTFPAPVTKPTVLEYSIEVTTEEKQVKPNQTATVLSRFVEYKNINDINFYHFTIPTVKPEIAVRPLQDMNVAIGFGGPSNAEPSHYEIRKRLDGTYFPHQNMSVRWWPKSTDGENKE